MKLSDIIQLRGIQRDDRSVFGKSAKRIEKRMAQIKNDNPKVSPDPTGWNIDMHQGSHNGINWR